jgi:hypothetical protein
VRGSHKGDAIHEGPNPVLDAPQAFARPGPRVAVTLLAVAALYLATPAGAQQESTGLPRRASVALEVAHRYARTQPARPDAVILAAQGTQEGHWRFVNRAGEMFTVGTPDEMQRVVSVLYPDARPGARLALYVTDDTVFRHGVAFKSLPAGAELHMVVGGEVYRLLRRDDPAGTQLFAEVRSNLAVELRSLPLLQEALWHLARPLTLAGVRLLALEPGGPSTVAAAPSVEAGTKRPLVDAIDPAQLPSALAGVPGQTLVVLARAERDRLYIRPAYGPEQALALQTLLQAADAADVSLLVLLAASTPRQPGQHNLLWEGSGIPGAEAIPKGTLADLLNAIAGPSRRMAVAATAGGRRTLLEVSLVGDLSGASAPRPADARFSGAAISMAAAGIYAVRASLLSAARQSDLDHRVIPGIPAAVQAGYLALLALGLLGTPVARAWWARLWPPEAASDYATRTGHWTASAVRFIAFALVFLPATAPVAAPYNLGSQIWDALRGPARWWQRMAGRGSNRKKRMQPPQAGRSGARGAAGTSRAPAPPPMPAPSSPMSAPVLAPAKPAPAAPPPRPAPSGPPHQEARRKPARSWIAALPQEEETQ